jgi:2'-5' RNA ligase
MPGAGREVMPLGKVAQQQSGRLNMKKYDAFVYCTFPPDVERAFPRFGRIANDDFEPPHVSVIYLPDLEENEIARSAAAIEMLAKRMRPFEAKIGKLDCFDCKGDSVPWYVHIESPRIHELREIIKEVLSSLDIPMNDKFPNFVPHATLRYLPRGAGYNDNLPSGKCLIETLNFAFKESE